MRFYIANFANLRNFTPNMIPISTAMWQPAFFKAEITKNKVVLGITERELSPYKVDMSEGCQKACPHRESVPECPFLTKYAEYLETVSFDRIMSECERVADGVRKLTNYEGEPIIVFLVYEAESNPCSERVPLQRWFEKHGVKLENWRKELAIESLC